MFDNPANDAAMQAMGYGEANNPQTGTISMSLSYKENDAGTGFAIASATMQSSGHPAIHFQVDEESSRAFLDMIQDRTSIERGETAAGLKFTYGDGDNKSTIQFQFTAKQDFSASRLSSKTTNGNIERRYL